MIGHNFARVKQLLSASHVYAGVSRPIAQQTALFHSSKSVRGFEEFFEIKKPNEVFTHGRGWTVTDLRRKSFEDMHKLWYVLYKERNVLLTEKERRRRMQRPTTPRDESRYSQVKKSMSAVKFVLKERSKIKKELENREKGLNSNTSDESSN